MMRKTIYKLFGGEIRVHEWEFDLVVLFIMFVGVFLGMFLVMTDSLGVLKALTGASVTYDTDADFATGTFTDVVTVGSGAGAYVQLEGQAPEGDSWLSSDWTYRRKLTFDNSGQTENLVNFPVLIKLSNGQNIDYSKTEDTGADLRFTDSDGTTLLSYEIEQWDEAVTSYVWVKVPQIDGSSTTDYIYMYYGNPTAADAQSAAGVWSNSYELVMHLDEAPANGVEGFADSSPNTHVGTPYWFDGDVNSTTDGNGKIAGSVRFEGRGGFGGEGSHVIVPELSGQLDFDTGDVITMEAWVEREMIYNKAVSIMVKGRYGTDGNFNYWIRQMEDYRYEFIYKTPAGANIIFKTSATNTRAYEFYKVTVVHKFGDNSFFKFYVDDVLQAGSWTSGSGNEAPHMSDEPFVLSGDDPSGAADYGQGDVNYLYNVWPGDIDEVRVSRAARSEDWIMASLLSENDNLITYDTEQEFGALPATASWESPVDSNIIDLTWNGGWGDGTAGSTAFSATVANLDANATIEFHMKTATTSSALSSAPYISLGTASSGTSFVKTAGELDALSLATGSNRYVQIQAELKSADTVSNPHLDNITLSYLRDNDKPSANASGIAMYQVNGGTEVSSSGWARNLSAYFDWADAADAGSGVSGYCLYLGQDSGGEPLTAKGLLGIGDTQIPASGCPFIISTSEIDFATTAYRGGTWLTSSATPYYLNIRAVDVEGNVYTDSLASFEFYYDDTLPQNPTYISLPGGFVSDKAVTITWPTTGDDRPLDDHSLLAGLQYRIGNSGTWYGDTHNGNQDLTDVLTNDGSYTMQDPPDFDNLQEGNNTIYFRALDNAGNVTTSYVTGVIKINTVAPAAPENLQVSPADNTTNSYSFTWDPPIGESDPSSLTYCYTVNTLPSVNTCSFTEAGASSLAADAYATQPGSNNLYLAAKSGAGNINYDAYVSVQFTYSGSAPGVPLNVEVADISTKATSSWKLAVTWSPPSDLGAGVEDYQIYRSNTATSCSANFGSFTQIGTTSGTAYTDSSLSQQEYSYCVKACDNANNCGAASATESGYPDGRFTTPANLVSGPNLSGVTARQATISWSTDRFSDSKVAYGTASGTYFEEEPSKSAQTTEHSITLSNLQPGTVYYYRAKWTDEDGNTGISEEKSFVTNDSPTVSNVFVSDINLTTSFITFTVQNASRAEVWYGKTTSYGGVASVGTSSTNSTHTVKLVGLDDGTTYHYKLVLYDADGYSYQVLEDNQFQTLPRPRVSDIKLQEVVGTAQPTVEATWSSNTGTSSIITYYPVSDPESERDQVEIDLRFEHRLQIVGLFPQTEYIMFVKGQDALGNEAVSDAQYFTTATDSRPPQISAVRVEGVVSSIGSIGGDPNVQLVVSWNTDEPATSQISYGEGATGVYTQKTSLDADLGYNHVVVISNLAPSKVYHLRVESTDAAGNVSFSGKYVTVTPKAVDSAIELVIGNLSEIFNFL